jgi:hypothetical protein
MEQMMAMMQQMPPEQMAQLMQAGMAGMGGPGGPGGGMPPGANVVQLTQEEADAIERLVSMGFDKDDAVQAFLACDKNEMLAANLLMDDMSGGGGMMDFADDAPAAPAAPAPAAPAAPAPAAPASVAAPAAAASMAASCASTPPRGRMPVIRYRSRVPSDQTSLARSSWV